MAWGVVRPQISKRKFRFCELLAGNREDSLEVLGVRQEARSNLVLHGDLIEQGVVRIYAGVKTRLKKINRPYPWE